MSQDDLRAALAGVDESYDVPIMEDCPVVPIGYDSGIYFFFDVAGQLRDMQARNLNAAGLNDLFIGNTGWLTTNFEPLTKATPFDHFRASAVLMQACLRAGKFDPVQAQRGVGLWPDTEFTGDARRLILHCGDECALLDPDDMAAKEDRWRPAGFREGRYVYGARKDNIGRPARGPISFDAAQDLLAFISDRWAWDKPKIAPLLMLGAIVAGYGPGILPYRPTVFLTAEASSGKTMLQKLAKRLLGDLAYWRDNATAAAIRNNLVGDDARPVIVDEFEMPSDDKNGRVKEIQDLIRSVFTQGSGGFARHGDVGRPINSIFILGAIQPPPMDAAEASRTAVLGLKALNASTQQIVSFEDALRLQFEKGPGLWRRFLDAWPRFEATFAVYRRLLLPLNPDVSRIGDTFGVLLACADLVLYPELRTMAELKEITDLVDEDLIGVAEGDGNSERCWRHFATSQQPNWHGGRKASFGTMLAAAIREESPHGEVRSEIKEWGILVTDAQGRVAHGDVRLGDRCIAIAKDHSSLNDVFKGTRWASGGYFHALKGLPGSALARNKPRFSSGARGTARAVLIDCARVLPAEEDSRGDIDDL
jgi:hypothetical protein